MIQLEKADICIDCDMVFDASDQKTCPKCGSNIVMPLSMWVFPMSRLGHIKAQVGKMEDYVQEIEAEAS